MAWFYDDFHRPSQPRATRGGIRSQSGRGGFGQNWWSRRWVEVLEELDLGGRLTRGRSYARRGQVLSIDIEAGMVTAEVQGSRRQPYSVEIGVDTLDPSDWHTLSEALMGRPIFAAMLLVGRMPENIEEVFQQEGLSLFPGSSDDLATDCTCPDWSNPCKHVAAVYLLLGEEFDRDPFLIFKLRGADRGELLGLAGVDAGADGPAPNDIDRHIPGGREATQTSPEPLPAHPGEFWGREDAETEHDAPEPASVPAVAADLPKRLGRFPFWRGERDFIEFLEQVYRQATPAGRDAYLGGRQAEDSEGAR